MIVENYIKYVTNFLQNYYKLFLGNQYEKKLIMPFIEKYIDVRYYNNSIYERGYSFMDKLNKELKNVAKEIVKQDKSLETKVKKIFILFGYVLYLDDCSKYQDLQSLMQVIITSTHLNEFDSAELKKMVSEFITTKNKFLNSFNDNNFEVKEKRIARNLKRIELVQNCKLSPIYSDWAIDKAYNSGTVFENRQYLLYIMASGKILVNSLNLEFHQSYLAVFPNTLFAKAKKINKYIKVLDNELVKSRLHLLITYKDYLDNTDSINALIKDGVNIAVTLDDSYDENIRILDIFSYVFVYEKYPHYDIVIANKDNIKSRIISM